MPKSIADLEQASLNSSTNTTDTLYSRGTATAPLNTASLASITVPTVGFYKIKASGRYGSVADTIDNMGLYKNGVLLIALSVVPAANTLGHVFDLRLNLAAGDVLAIKPINSGAATTVYVASLFVDPA